MAQRQHGTRAFKGREAAGAAEVVFRDAGVHVIVVRDQVFEIVPEMLAGMFLPALEPGLDFGMADGNADAAADAAAGAGTEGLDGS
jgi:hypothetical protein